MEKAFVSTGTAVSGDVLELLTLRVVADFVERSEDCRISVETIQDSVERVLMQSRRSARGSRMRRRRDWREASRRFSRGRIFFRQYRLG